MASRAKRTPRKRTAQRRSSDCDLDATLAEIREIALAPSKTGVKKLVRWMRDGNHIVARAADAAFVELLCLVLDERA
jgi:hypothetical protein